MPRPKKEQEQLTPAQMLVLLGENLKKQAVTPNINGYKPHAKQMLFHKSPAKGRLYIGGNRSGKSYGSVAEDVFYARGRHPYRTIPGNGEPTRGRVVAVDYLQGVEKIILPLVSRLIPPSELLNGSWEDSYNKQLRTLTLTNDATIEFMSYESDLEKFAGTSRHWVHFDEEPPKHIFNECLARLVDTDGDWWISMTPVEGMTWVYDDIYMPGKEGKKGIDVIEADMLDNPHIKPEAAERFLSGLDDEERKAREHGNFVQLGGLVFKRFDPAIHVIPYELPSRTWEWYLSLDHGYNNPTAIYWHAVSPEGNAITFAEHYQREMLVEQHAAVIHARNAGFARIPDLYVADPAIAQRNGVTGTSIHTEYANHGIPFALGNNDVLTGVSKMASYIKPNYAGKPKWHITENCVELIRELRKLRWKTWASKKAQLDNNRHDQVHKKDDHGFDSCRYFFTFLPDLSPITDAAPGESTQIAGQTVYPSPNYDANLQRERTNYYSTSSTDWRVSEGSGELTALEYD